MFSHPVITATIIITAPFWAIAIAALFCDRADRREAEARDRHPSNYR